MSARFEDVLRPYQLPNNTPPQRIVTQSQQTTPNVLLQIGRTGTGKVFNGSYSLKITYYSVQSVNEQTTSLTSSLGFP